MEQLARLSRSINVARFHEELNTWKKGTAYGRLMHSLIQTEGDINPW